MEINNVSERLGALRQGQEDLAKAFDEHKTSENKWQESVDKKLDLLLSDRNQRLGVARAAENKAKIWVAVISAAVVSAFEFVKWTIFGA